MSCSQASNFTPFHISQGKLELGLWISEIHGVHHHMANWQLGLGCCEVVMTVKNDLRMVAGIKDAVRF